LQILRAKARLRTASALIALQSGAIAVIHRRGVDSSAPVLLTALFILLWSALSLGTATPAASAPASGAAGRGVVRSIHHMFLVLITAATPKTYRGTECIQGAC
jgi:hypothetical protein